MPQTEQTYTYRAGQRVTLNKPADQFVVRALPDELREIGITDAEQVSSGSSRVTTRGPDLEAMMSRSRDLAPTHHAYYRTDTGQEFLITDRVLVTFKEPPSAEQLDDFAGRYALVRKAAFGERDYLFQLTDHTGMNPVKLVVHLNEEEPLVEQAEHDLNQRLKKYTSLALPTDPSYARQWHLHTRLNHEEFDPRASTRCEAAWQMLDHFGSADVVVGVTDDGCKLDHPDFDSTGKFAAWGYFRGSRLITNADVDARREEMYKAGANHGTSCAGVIAGEADALLTVGAAPGCRLLPIQWESNGPFLLISDSKLLTAINFIADKVDVLSNSWGGAPTTEWWQQIVDRMTQLARTRGRRGRGIVFLWAAGNENCPIQHTADRDVPFTDGWEFRNNSWVWVGVETARRFSNNLVGIEGVMHIAALASNARRSHYSNYGSGIDLCAPTSNSHEYHRLTLSGLGVTTTTGSLGGITDDFGGTSSATPLVAGVAALVLSANPQLTALEVISILKKTASKDLDLQGYGRTPPASFDPTPTWDVSPIAPFDRGDFRSNGDADGTWSPWFGHGRVDAANAVAAAIGRRTTPGGQVFRKAATPGLNIPDNTPAGVRDTITFATPAAVASIKITLDITHTYIGDLRVTLTSPAGTSVTLHDRNGGNMDNLQRSFDLSTTPALATLAGQPVAGNWVIVVQDLAAVDVGTLNRWELEISGHTQTVVALEEIPGAAIPDNNSLGIERILNNPTDGMVQDIEVALDITHTYIGDLRVDLFAPDGTAVPLHQRNGGSADNLIRTYTPMTTPGLQVLRGRAIQGSWKLKVADVDAKDIGKLNRWALKIVRQE